MTERGVNRRALLTALPAAAVAGAAPATGATETPVRRLYREWERRYDEMDAAYALFPNDDAPELLAAIRRVREVEDRMFAEPATCLADMAIKLCVANGFGDWDMGCDDQLWAEARALIA